MADETIPTAPDTPDDVAAAPEAEEGALAPSMVPAPPPVHLPAMPLFGKWDTHQITIPDVGLARYINLAPYAGVPHNGGRHANTHFAKMRIPLVERLINHLMRTENYTGKKLSSYNVVKRAFQVVEERTKDHPVQVFVNALCNAAPKEETTRLRYGGISVPKAVDTAPQRRLDLAIRFIAQGAVEASHRNPKPIHMCLADEITKAAKGDMTSFAMAKKDDAERVAKSAR